MESQRSPRRKPGGRRTVGSGPGSLSLLGAPVKDPQWRKMLGAEPTERGPWAWSLLAPSSPIARVPPAFRPWPLIPLPLIRIRPMDEILPEIARLAVIGDHFGLLIGVG